MFSSIILESVKEYIPNSYIENNEKYDFIVGSKVKKKLVFKIIHNYIFIFSRIKDNNFSLLIHEISEKIKNIKGKNCIIYIYDFDLVEENNKFLFFIKKCKRVNSFIRINRRNGQVYFSANKDLENKICSERYVFLLNEYKLATKNIWQNELNNFYDICFKIRKK